MRVSIVALDGVFDTGLAVTRDAFAIANELAGRASPFDVAITSVRRRIATGQGLRVPTSLPGAAPDYAIIPALAAKQPDALDVALGRPEAHDAMALVREWQAEGSTLAAACTGTFVLAGARVLDEHPATTSWWLAAAFRERFPRVELQDSRMLVEAPGLITAGAALAHLDLALWIIRRKSPALARATSRYLLFDHGPSQAAYAIPAHVAHRDPVVERFEAWARQHLQSFSMPTAARAIGASERTVERHVQSVLGRSPLSFVQDLRVERALVDLETTDDSLDAIAERVGYDNATTLRTLLRKKTGRGVRHLRARRA